MWMDIEQLPEPTAVHTYTWLATRAVLLKMDSGQPYGRWTAVYAVSYLGCQEHVKMSYLPSSQHLGLGPSPWQLDSVVKVAKMAPRSADSGIVAYECGILILILPPAGYPYLTLHFLATMSAARKPSIGKKAIHRVCLAIKDRHSRLSILCDFLAK